MQQIKRLCAYLGWIGVAIALLTGCLSEGSTGHVGALPTSTPSEALRRDAEAYAKQFGVTVEEATARMRFQDEIGDLNDALRTNEADTFGGLWIETEPDYRAVVLFTRRGERTIRPYLAGKPYAHLVEVRQARYTLAELEAIQAQAMHELDKLDFDVVVLLSVQDNRVQVPVSDREWFESELRRADARLPKGVELVVAEGSSTARNKDLLLTPPVPGIAFPRQKPTEGFREAMMAELVGTLRLEGACLYVQSLGGGSILPIWPPEFTLRLEGDQVLVIDREGQVAARAGEDVYMSGGYVGVTDEWVLQQIPPACRGEYFVVGNEVRPNLRHDLVESPGSTAPPTPVPSCLQASSPSHPSRLIVEEHPLETKPIPAEAIPAAGPGFLAYFETSDGDTDRILGRNQVLRDIHALMLTSNNALLAPFGYRLALSKCGETGTEWYTLYQGDKLYQEPVYGLSRVSVNASGTDFVLPLDLVDGPYLLTGSGLARRDPADHPVYVGDELLTARASDAIEIYLGGKPVYRDLVTFGPVPAIAPGSPWSYDGHWVVEQIERIESHTGIVMFKGHVIQDGQDLNQRCGYQESFGLALLDGRPFYFATRDAKIDIAYDGQQVAAGYDRVPHYQGCSAAALNPGTSQSMVWFFATRGYQWYYVEAYVPLAERPSPTPCPTPAPVLAPTVSPFPTTVTLPGAPQPGTVWARPTNKDEMVIRYVPAGPFYMGSPEGVGGESEHPLHVVTLDPFWIDETEVTQGRYQTCVEAGACDAQDVDDYDPLAKWNHPIEVTWDVAQAYCHWAGGRLPTEAEWEKAARGIDARPYPWGEKQPDCCRANHDSVAGPCFKGVAPAGSCPAGASPYGVLDMAGNVAEWVNDGYDPGYYARSPEQNPPGPDSGKGRVVRGGSWRQAYPHIRAAYRDVYDPGGAIAGFRCVVPEAAYTVVPSDRFEGWYRYTNLDYGFSFHYPPDWTLEHRVHQLTFRHQVVDTLRFTVEYRRVSEGPFLFRTGMPAGEFTPRGSVAFLGRELARNVLVYGTKDKLVLYEYGDATPWGDMVFSLVLEDGQTDYEAAELPQDVQNQVDQIVSTFELYTG